MSAVLLIVSTTGAAQNLTLVAQDGNSPPVARVVKGIISYTHWPAEPEVVQLCLVGNSRYQDQLLSGMQQLPGRVVRAQRMPMGNVAVLSGCNAFYLAEGAQGPVRPNNRSILTISERDPACRGGSMFCLNIVADRVSFDLNLDSVARSGLRVDPKALMLGHAGERRP